MRHVLRAGLALLLGLALPLAGLGAAAGRQPHPPTIKAPLRPPPGWVVDRVRIEPVTPDSAVGVDGLGDYRGALELASSPGGVAVVNDVGLEDYVRGISEVPSSWPPEALKAQAIAARTYVLHEIARGAAGDPKAAGAQICSTDSCQVYAGLAKERQAGGANWSAAVTATAGEVLLYKGAPILAKYSASNGGRSVAGGQPYLRAVADPDDARSPENQWHVTVPLGDVATLFEVPGAITAVQRIAEVAVIDWQAPDGGAGQSEVALGDFRTKLNRAVPAPGGLPQTVPSYQFALGIDAAAGTLVLDGRGWGHGIGMSQYGALGKAQRGLKATDILAAYYGGLRPEAARLAPSSVRVLLDAGRPSASVAGTDQFRLLDGSGHALSVAASGHWQVLPASHGTLRVVPPPGQDGVPTLSPAVLEPAVVPAEASSVVRFRLSTPALVQVSVADASGVVAPAPAAPVLVQPGESAQPVPAPGRAGNYTVTIRADAGAGRVASLPLVLTVSGPRQTVLRPFPQHPSVRLDSHGRPATRGLEAAAGALLILAAAGAVRAFSRRWPLRLH